VALIPVICRIKVRVLQCVWASIVLLLSLLPSPVAAIEKASEQVSAFYGSFSHSIPIEVPGFRGLEPKIALSYSSEGRNGFVGVGWGLSGFSTIQRVNQGLGTPKFDATDTYLLDAPRRARTVALPGRQRQP
jgi:hypothetical protein